MHERIGPVHQAQRPGAVQAGQGVGQEFTFIIAAVVGGCLLTGGFGSAIGASIGASIIGMAFIGIAFAGWNTDWSFLFLGLILGPIVAALFLAIWNIYEEVFAEELAANRQSGARTRKIAQIMKTDAPPATQSGPKGPKKA